MVERVSNELLLALKELKLEYQGLIISSQRFVRNHGDYLKPEFDQEPVASTSRSEVDYETYSHIYEDDSFEGIDLRKGQWEIDDFEIVRNTYRNGNQEVAEKHVFKNVVKKTHNQKNEHVKKLPTEIEIEELTRSEMCKD